jgi:F-type H+-transporting ATPase subunit gamma
MSESLIETRRRIATIESTEKITKAMKLVAAVKYQKCRKAFEDNLEYYSSMRQIMLKTINKVDLSKLDLSQYLSSYSNDKTLYVVMTSSLGLCGSYNYNIFRLLDPILKEGDELLIIGQKGFTHYKDSKYKVIDDYVGLLDDFNYTNVRMLRHYLFRIYRENKYKGISLVYTHYKNSMTFVPTIYQVAPFDENDLKKDDNQSTFAPDFVPDATTCCNQILSHYVDAMLYSKMLECQLSEQASRRNAMESATDSADEIVQQLKIVYNKSRQNAITQEITEVIAGANAGKKDDE